MNEGVDIMKDLEKRKKITGEIIIFSTAVTVVAFCSLLLGGSPSKPGIGFVLWGIAPLLVAIIMRIVTKDWSDAGFKPAFRKNAKWYIISILAFPVMTVITYITGDMISVITFTDFSIGAYMKTFLSAVPVFLVFAVFEEVGWRGYLVPKFASAGRNSFLAYAITAVIWSTWHLPYFRELAWIYSSENIIFFLPRFYIVFFAFSILYNEIRIITGSVWPAILMHCIMNSFGHPLAADYIKVVPGYEFLVSPIGLFMAVLIGVLGIGLNRWRMKKQSLYLG